MEQGYYSHENPQNLIRTHHVDVAIVGGGMAGTSAAVTAARLGLRTLLAQNRPCLGGAASTECECNSDGHLIVGGSNWTTRDARETGVIEEFRMTSADRYENGWRNHFSQVLRDIVEKENNLTLLLNTEVYDIKMEGRKIRELTARTLGSDLTHHIFPKMVIDCSGDSFVGVTADAKYRQGREAKAEFNESLAPEESDSCVLGSSLYFRAVDVGHPVKFTPPEWADHIDESMFVNRSHQDVTRGYWWLECGGDMDTVCDNEQIYKNLLKILYGIWDHIKNGGDHGADNFAIEWISSIPAKRESRRLIGDHILTEGEILAHSTFPDGIAYSGGNVDIHPIKGFYSGDEPSGGRHGILSPGLYQIPLRCLYSQNVENLMMAGRNISVSHVALSSTRMMGTCSILGQAAAATTFLCVKYSEGPRQIAQKRIEELFRILHRVDHTIPGGSIMDPDNLCAKASVKVSSSMKLKLMQPGTGMSEKLSEHEIPSAQSFIATTESLDEAIFLMNNSSISAVTVHAELVRQKEMYEFTTGEVLATASCTLPPGNAIEGHFSFQAKLQPGTRYYIRMSNTPNIESCLCEHYLPGVWKSKMKRGWPPQGDRHNHCIRFIPEQHPFEGENLLNEDNRGGDALSIWVSDPDAGFPQSAEILFPERSLCSCAELVFDTGLDHINIYSRQQECVKEYVLEGIVAGKYQLLAEEKDNFLRFRKHVFPPVMLDGIRLIVKASNGDPSARVYQIRAYKNSTID